MQCTHLVVHERDERRHHDGDAVARTLARNGRNLVAERLAAARGHEHQRIATATHVVNDGFLGATKRAVAKHFAQDLLRIHRRGHGNFRGGRGFNKGMKALLSLLLTMAG